MTNYFLSVFVFLTISTEFSLGLWRNFEDDGEFGNFGDDNYSDWPMVMRINKRAPPPSARVAANVPKYVQEVTPPAKIMFDMKQRGQMFRKQFANIAIAPIAVDPSIALSRGQIFAIQKSLNDANLRRQDIPRPGRNRADLI